MKWSFLLGVAPFVLGLGALASLACTPGEDAIGTPAPTQARAESLSPTPTPTPSPTPTPTPSPTPTPTPSPTPTPTPITIPPQVTLDLDPSLTEQELSYLRQTIGEALQQAEADFGISTPEFTVVAYRDAVPLAVKRAETRGGNASQYTSFFSCDFCAGAQRGMVMLRLGTGWFDHSKFPTFQVGKTVLSHEIYHIFQIHALRQYNDNESTRGPAWLMEGSAQWNGLHTTAQSLDYPWEEIVKLQEDRLREDNASTLETLASFQVFSQAKDGYAIGFSAVELLVKEGESSNIGKFYTMAGSGTRLEVAFQTAFGISLPEFYAKFAEYRAGLAQDNGKPGTISGRLANTTAGVPVPSGIIVCASLVEDPGSCWRGVVSQNEFTIEVPPGVYILTVHLSNSAMRHYSTAGTVRDRTQATKLDTKKGGISGIIMLIP